MLFKQKISYHLVKAGQISQYISAHGSDLYGIEVASQLLVSQAMQRYFTVKFNCLIVQYPSTKTIVI